MASLVHGKTCGANSSDLVFRCYTTDPDKRWELCSPELQCSAQGSIAKSPLIIQSIKLLGCIKENVKYQPIDDVLGAPRSMEISAEACQARCASNSECAFFSFWAKDLPEDNGCTLFGPDAVFAEQREVESSSEKAKMYQFVTGPAACQGAISTDFFQYQRQSYRVFFLLVPISKFQ